MSREAKPGIRNSASERKKHYFPPLLLCLIPFFGFFGLLYMGQRSGRKIYTRFGRIYGVLQLLLSVLFVVVYVTLIEVLGSFSLVRTRYSDLGTGLWSCTLLPIPVGMFQGMSLKTAALRLTSTQLLRYLGVFFSLSRVILNFGCILHTMLLARGYIKYMREVIEPRERISQDPLLSDGVFRRRELLPLLWVLAFPVAPAALVFFGKKADRKNWIRLGNILCLLQAAVFLYLTVLSPALNTSFVIYDYNSLWYAYSRIPKAAAGLFFAFCPLYVLLLCFIYRKEMLERAAVRHRSDVTAAPSMANLGWRSATAAIRLSHSSLMSAGSAFCGRVFLPKTIA